MSVDQISIDARTIDVALEDRQINATDVKTTLSPQKAVDSRPARRPAAASRFPACCVRTRPRNINADALDYRGMAGQAVYRGKADALAGQTRRFAGTSISLDQEKGNLVATGSARSTLELDTGLSIGQRRRDPLRRRRSAS